MKRPESARPPYRTARERVAARRAEGGPPPRSRSPRRRGCSPIVAVGGAAALVLLLALLAAGRWAGGALGALEEADPRRPSPAAGVAPAELPASLREPFNVLLVGVDRRESPEEGVRSDTLIVVHVDPTEGWAGMLAIPRDSVVQVPGLGLQKINTAYTYGFNNAARLYGEGTAPEAGGGALAAETVEGFLGLEVDYIAQVDFSGFERIVNTLGGISLDVERPLLDSSYPTEDYGYERIYIPAGLQVMDGETALRYARSRHSSSDFDRSARQQQVLRAMLAEVRARGLLSQAALLPDLARDLEASVSTTLPLSDLETLRGLAALAAGLDASRIVSLSLNPNDVRVVAEQGSDIYWEPADVAAQVARLLAGPDGPAELARVVVLNGAGVRGLAGRVSGRLEAQGFTVNPPADAPLPAERTRLIDYAGRPETLRRLADTLGLDPGQVYTTPPADAPQPPFQADIVLLIGADYAPAWVGE
ncbi:MAG TPA: LCP family protein [Chloroflexaceae bacterium]|nr:LCP family protein [Chloroflexaceae bacterium]